MKIHVKSSPGNLSQAVVDAMVELNRGLWHVRQNQGSEGSPGIQVLLPEFIDFEVELIADGGANALTAITSTSEPEVITRETRTEGAQVTNSQEDVKAEQNDDTVSTGKIRNARDGGDESTEILTYE